MGFLCFLANLNKIITKILVFPFYFVKISDESNPPSPFNFLPTLLIFKAYFHDLTLGINKLHCTYNNESFCILLYLLEDQLVKIINELFVAGTETTATALRWFCLFMIRYPKVQEKMRKEVYDVIGTSRFPRLEDKPSLPYCEAVIHETLRVGAIGPFSIPHGLSRDLHYNGFIIPKDALLIQNLYSSFFDEKIFPDPHAFKPERFLDEKGSLQNTEKVLVFSLGKSLFCSIL